MASETGVGALLTLDQLVAECGLMLVAGGADVPAPVRSVHSSELLDPTPWLSGGELLLTTGLRLDTPRVQREYVERLVAHGIAGLGFGTGFDHARVPASLLTAARRRGLPVFEVPYEVSFIEITERAFAHLINEQYDRLRRIMAIQGRLERLVLDDRGLAEVVRLAAEAIGGAVGVITARGETLAWCPGRDSPIGPELDRLAAELQDRSGEAPSGPIEGPLGDEGLVSLALPVAGRERGAPQAWLIGVCDRERLGDSERLILQQTVTVVALELMRLRIEADTERRLAGDVLAEALTGRLIPEELQARLRPFGIGERACVLAFWLKDPAAGGALLERAMKEAELRGLVATRGPLLCAVLDGAAGDPLEHAGRLRRELAGQLGDVRASASRTAPTQSLRTSFHEARCALEAVRWANGNAPEVASHRDLGAFQLLLSVQDDEALRVYADGVLGAIEEPENGYGHELLRSLDVFIEHNGNWERAAGALYCHRHTLRYRIRRAEQLTGRDFSSARDRIEVWLALRARELAV